MSIPKDKKKILFLIPAMTGGGAQKVFATFLRTIQDPCIELHLGLTRTDGPFIKNIPETVEIHRIYSKRVISSFISIIRLVWRIKPDVVLSTPGHLNLLVAGIRFFFPRKTRLWLREANTPSIHLRQYSQAWLIKLLYRYLYRLANGVVCQSSMIRDDLVKNFQIPSDKVVILGNPVDRDMINRYVGNDPSPYRGGKQISLVASGKLQRQKGFDLLIDVIALLKNMGVDVLLTLLGEGTEESFLRDKVETLHLQDNVFFAGFQENPYPYYAHADLFILPSRWEGMANVALEALACGVPVVAFDSAGNIKDIISHGINGWIIPSGDIQQMANIIVDVINKKAHQKERDLLPNRFSAEIVSAELISSVFTDKLDGCVS